MQYGRNMPRSMPPKKKKSKKSKKMVGNQSKLDKMGNNNGKIDAGDFKKMREKRRKRGKGKKK